MRLLSALQPPALLAELSVLPRLGERVHLGIPQHRGEFVLEPLLVLLVEDALLYAAVGHG